LNCKKIICAGHKKQKACQGRFLIPIKGFPTTFEAKHQLGAPNACGYRLSRTTDERVGQKGASGPVLHSKIKEKTMLDPKTLEQFGAKMSALLANSPAKDIENNAKAMISGLLGKLDLVTREEFDVQTQVLARTREKLKELEARVDALEKARQA
jgi:BMFP domain-containing protein YqiC